MDKKSNLYPDTYSDKELAKMVERVRRENRELKEETEKQDWEKDFGTESEKLTIPTAAYELGGIVTSLIYRPVNFDKKFRIVIDHDPEQENERMTIRYYDQFS